MKKIQQSIDIHASVDIDIDEEYADIFEEQWTLALAKLKAVCEEKLAVFASITVEAIVEAPMIKELYREGVDIMHYLP